jgi:hypothetical protein
LDRCSRWAHGDVDAAGTLAETAVLVGSDAYGVLLGSALGVLGSSFSLGEVHSLKDRDVTSDSEGSVLGLDSEGCVGSLCALAAVGLADLVELHIWLRSEFADLSCLCVLEEGLGETRAQGWQLSEVAGALWELSETWLLDCDVVTVATPVASLDLSEVLCTLLSKTVSDGALGIDSASEEGHQQDNVAFHFSRDT